MGPKVPVRGTTLFIVPITIPGGASELAPPAEMMGEPTATSPKRGWFSINRTTGVRDNPRPSNAPVSRSGRSAPGGTVMGDLLA